MSSETSPAAIYIPRSTDWAQKISKTAETNMQNYDNCTQSIVSAFLQQFNLENPAVLQASSAFFGGMLSSLTCGVHSAGVLIIGLLVGRRDLDEGIDGLYPMVFPIQSMIKRLNLKIGSHSCFELTGVDFTDLNSAIAFRQSEDHLNCIKRVADGARVIAELLQELDRDGHLFRPGSSVSNSTVVLTK